MGFGIVVVADGGRDPPSPAPRAAIVGDGDVSEAATLPRSGLFFCARERNRNGNPGIYVK
jgi:hypothetical protein